MQLLAAHDGAGLRLRLPRRRAHLGARRARVPARRPAAAPGGYVDFDDYRWTLARSPSMSPEAFPDVRRLYSDEQIDERRSRWSSTCSCAATRATRRSSRQGLPQARRRVTPLVSVCIPRATTRRFLGEAVASALAQDVDGLEVLVHRRRLRRTTRAESLAAVARPRACACSATAPRGGRRQPQRLLAARSRRAMSPGSTPTTPTCRARSRAQAASCSRRTREVGARPRRVRDRSTTRGRAAAGRGPRRSTRDAVEPRRGRVPRADRRQRASRPRPSSCARCARAARGRSPLDRAEQHRLGHVAAAGAARRCRLPRRAGRPLPPARGDSISRATARERGAAALRRARRRARPARRRGAPGRPRAARHRARAALAAQGAAARGRPPTRAASARDALRAVALAARLAPRAAGSRPRAARGDRAATTTAATGSTQGAARPRSPSGSRARASARAAARAPRPTTRDWERGARARGRAVARVTPRRRRGRGGRRSGIRRCSRLSGRRGRNFPDRALLPDGYPRDGAAAVAHLEQLRRRRASRTSSFPRASFWWLDHYPALGAPSRASAGCACRRRLRGLRPAGA